MLKNKLALVTGAASGLGNAVAYKLAKHGANVALVDVDKNLNVIAKEIEITTKNSKVLATSHTCDVSDSIQVSNLLNEIRAQHSNQIPTIVGMAWHVMLFLYFFTLFLLVKSK